MSYAVIANSPSIGFIAWSGVHIVYDGVDYPVTDGSTNKRFIFWQKASGGALQVSDTYPSLTIDDAIVFLNKGGVPISVLNASSTEGDLVVPGTITSRAIATETIVADNIKTDAIIARHVLAGSIIAEKLSVQELSAISANLGTMTAGNITLAATGFVRGGAVNFASGVGIWMGYDNGYYKMRAGAPGSSRMEWNGTAFNIYDGSGNLTISSGIVDYAKIPDRPTTLAGINAGEGSKLAGIEAAATRNVNRGNWVSGAAYAPGDIVLEQGVSWSARTTHTASATVRPPTYPTVSNADWTILAVKGADGSNGLNGTRTAILDVYRWSATAPTTFPSGTSTYTWATGQFTAPAALNSWSLTPPTVAQGQTLWIARQLFADSNTSATSSVTWSVATAIPETYAGSNGVTGSNGSRTAVLEVYQWSGPAPTAFPSGASTYSWSDGSFTAPTLNGWSLTPGAAVPGQTLWATSVRYADLLTSATSSVTWNSTSTYAVGGAGANGSNAKAAFLAASSQVFQISKALVTTPADVTLTAYGQNVSGSPTFTVTSGTATLSGAGSTRTLTAAGMITDSVTVQMTWDGQTDFVTVVKVREGTDGLSGITAIISNESHTLPSDTVGVVSSYSGSGFTIQVFEGSTALTASAGGTVGAFRLGTISTTPASALTPGGITYSGTSIIVSPHSGMSNSVDSAILSLPITVYRANGAVVSLSRSQTLTKSKSGATGQTGAPGANSLSAIVSNESHTFPAATDGTVTSYANSGTEIRVYDGATELAYDGVGTASGSWKVTTSANNIAAGSLTDSGTFLTVGAHGTMGSAQDTALINYTISGKNTAGQTFSLLKQQTFSKSKSGATGAQGPTLVVLSNRPASFTSLDGNLEVGQADIVLSASTQGIGSPSYVWTFGGLQTAPASSGAATQTITAAQFGTSKSAIVACTVNGTFYDVITIVRLEKSTAQAGATFGADWGSNVTGAAAVNDNISNATARSNTRPNLVYNGGFENGFSGWIGNTSALQLSDSVWGRTVLGSNITGTGVIAQNNSFVVQPGENYTITGDSVLLNATGGAVYFDIEWLDAAGTTILGDSLQSPVFSSHDFATNDTNRLAHVKQVLSPANAYRGRARFVWEAITGTGVFVGARQIKVERGVLPATPYSADATLTALQKNANDAQTAADTANTVLANIASDGILTRGEKPAVILEYNAITAEYPQLQSQGDALGLNASSARASFDTAVSALQVYLTGLSPAYSDTASDTIIVGSTFRQKFVDYYFNKQVFLNAIAAKAATLSSWGGVTGTGKPEDNATVGANWATNVVGATGVNANIATQASRLNTRPNLTYNGGFENGFNGWVGNTSVLQIVDDVWGRVALGYNITGTGVIAQNNTVKVQPGEWYTVTGDSVLLGASAGAVYFDIEWLNGSNVILNDSAQAGLSANHDFATADTNRAAHAVNVQAPAGAAYGRARFVWESIAGTNAVVGCRQIKMERGLLPATPYSADATLPVLQNNLNLAKKAADDSTLAIANITSDSVLSQGEKSAARQEYSVLANEQAGINAQGDALGVGHVAYDAAILALQQYLGGLSPAWDNPAVDTPIDGATFRQKFINVHLEKQALINAIAASAATRANWSTISGAGKPQDNATVGANTSNLNVGIASGNRISNSGPYPGTIDGFSLGFDNTGKVRSGVLASYDPWRPTGQGGVLLTFAANQTPPNGSVSDINNNGIRYPVVAGQRYEASVYLSTHRCLGEVRVAWFDQADVYITEVSGNAVVNYQSQGQLSNWQRSVLFATAPANAATASVYVRSAYDGSATPYTFCSMWYFGSALPAQTVASDWSNGQGANWATNVVGAAGVNNNITAAQDAADTAQGAANTANNALARIASDGYLSKGEKPAVILEYTTISQEYPGIQTQANGLGISTANFNTAVAALQTYLSSTIPTWNDAAVDTTIDGPTFRLKFTDYYYQRQELLNAIALQTANRLRTRTNLIYNGGFENGFNGWSGNTGSLAISDGVWGRSAVGTGVSGTGVLASQLFAVQAGQVYTITADSLFLNATSGGVYLDIQWLNGSGAIISDSLQGVISTSHDFSDGDSNRLAHAVAVTAPTGATGGKARFVWESVAGSAIVGVRQIKVERGPLPATPYSADATLPVLQNNANAAQLAADTANGAIANISSDSVLSRGEKPAVNQEYSSLDAEYAGIISQAAALSVSSVDYANAMTALRNYLGGLSPQWNDSNTDTAIVGATFRQKFIDLYYNRQVTLNAIAAKAATLSSWGGISGTGKPQDNATVGANDSNLQVGIGANLIPNSDFLLSKGNWQVGYIQSPNQNYLIARDLAGDDWRPSSGHNIGINRSGAVQGTIDLRGEEVPVIAGARYELSGRVASQRCAADLAIVFVNASGGYVSEVHAPQGGRSAGGRSLAAWELQYVFFNVPANATSAYVMLRAYALDSGATDSYSWLTQPMLCRAGAGQAQPSPWSPGNFAEQITPANASTYIANAAIGSAQIGSIALVGQSSFNVKTGVSGQRIEMDSRFIKVFDVSGVKRVQIGDLSA